MYVYVCVCIYIGDIVYNTEISSGGNSRDCNESNPFYSSPIPLLNPNIQPSPPSLPTKLQTKKRQAAIQMAKYRQSLRRSKSSASAEQQPTQLEYNKTSPLLNLRFPLTLVIENIQKKYGVHFQTKFSQYVRIVDMPPP